MKKNLFKAVFASFTIALLIFSLGLFAGYGLDILRIKDVSIAMDNIELETLDYITSKEYLDVFGGDSCLFLSYQLSGITPKLRDIGQDLVNYEKKNIFSGSEYSVLKSKYFLLEIRAYTLFTKMKNDCGYNANFIIYFYDQNDNDSERQGYILDTLVDIHENIHVFSFDRDFEIIDFLVLRYNISSAPTVIINEEKVFEGLTTLEEINEYLENEP